MAQMGMRLVLHLHASIDRTVSHLQIYPHPNVLLQHTPVCQRMEHKYNTISKFSFREDFMLSLPLRVRFTYYKFVTFHPFGICITCVLEIHYVFSLKAPARGGHSLITSDATFQEYLIFCMSFYFSDSLASFV